jgi:outer membrane receptor protein involved in Fe transport
MPRARQSGFAIDSPTFALLAALAALATLLQARPARAADLSIEVPVIVFDGEDGDDYAGGDELDLANLVTSAAKNVSTVQEAPAIITILPVSELHEGQGRTLGEIADRIPGFLRFEGFNGNFPQIVVRGIMQAVLPLHDGFSLFDPFVNASTLHRGVPLEMVKRIETISGPGGVLWGANSFLGVVNVITKDASDIDGVEASFGYADGKGDRSAYRGYVMAGIPRLFGSDHASLVLHASYEDYLGPIYTRSGHMFSTPLPNPNSLYYYGPIRDTDPRRSQIFDLDGKLTLGNLTLQWMVPSMSRHMGVGLNGVLAVRDLAEDHLAECQNADPLNTTDHCYDPGRATRESRVNFYERYGFAEYKARLSPTAGLSLKAYVIQFVRHFDPLLVLMPVPGVIEGGLSFIARNDVYRAGSSLDGDFAVGERLHVLYGFEAFHEWLANDVERSREGDGTEGHFLSPYDLGKLPFACPRTATWDAASRHPVNADFVAGCPVTAVFAVDRTTIGGFTQAELRVSPRLVLDGGVRLQAAPELDEQSAGYGLAPTLSAAAVYELAPDWHVKLNYAEGFRPPVFNNTNSNGDAIEIDGSEDLKVEKSRSGTVEVNSRLLRNQRMIRELDLRADYSYTTLENYIAFIAGRYANTGDRGIHSVELLAKLYLKGGHRVQLGYTFNQMSMSDKGVFASLPNNWLDLGVVNRLGPRLELSTFVQVYGSFEDPNRRVEARGLSFDPMTGAALPGAPHETVTVQAYETVMDRLPPAAELQVGLDWQPTPRLEMQLTAYNALDDERWTYDNADDLEPRLEITPSQFEAFRVFGSATVTF